MEDEYFYTFEFQDALDSWEAKKNLLLRVGDRATEREIREAAYALHKLNRLAAIAAKGKEGLTT